MDKKTIECIYPNNFPDYIGLKIEKEDRKFIFPYGYQKSTNEDLKKDMLNLLKMLDRYRNLKNVNDSFKNEYNFPFDTYIWIIQDFINNGYYNVDSSLYKEKNMGNIDWGKTIKKNNILINNENIIYNKYIVREKKKDLNIITEIHKYCVYEAIDKMGWYYNIDTKIAKKPDITLKVNLMINMLNNEYIKSFTDKKKNLIKNMITLLRGLDRNKFNTKSFDLSTNEFEYIFERLIEERFGNVDVSKYYPKSNWHINGKTYPGSYLRPDTIFIKGDTAYIIDAKFYKYGYTKDIQKDLPNSTSVQKQITYAEDLILNNPNIKNVFNVFLLPYSSNSLLEYIGYADTTWKDSSNKYEKVYAVNVDLKSLVNDRLGSKDKYQESLIKILESVIIKNSKFEDIKI